MFRIKYIIIFLFLLSCSSEQKMLEKCADQTYKSGETELKFVKKGKYLVPEPKEVTIRKVKDFLNKRVSEKLNNSVYEDYFDKCLHELRYKEPTFKAKYK